ncbi:MAG: hypothetical protein DRI74_10435 [Bacteroidetes bacterium]|nr:MAG: hypothetical protein DRI74_10435 [Bacteroidota bacterium]
MVIFYIFAKIFIMNVHRYIYDEIMESLEHFPITAIIGARQVGKTTLAKQVMKHFENALYIDLEKPSDRTMLSDAEQFFKFNNGKLICLDEIQLLPEIYPLLRSLIDDEQFDIKFLITGSASPDLLQKSSESLAGRIAYYQLPVFLLNEIGNNYNLENYWFRGGFPLSLLSPTNKQSIKWLDNFILTFLERDLKNFGFSIPSETINRLWKMLAHVNGQILNYSLLSNSMGYSDTTIKKYIDILTNTYMLRIIKPYYLNTKKRLIKSPKLYFRDTGILHRLLNIRDFNELFQHPAYGNSWETLCIENIINTFNHAEPFYYRTSGGNEIDLVLTAGGKNIAIEFKTSSSPTVTKGFWQALDDLKSEKAFIIAPVKAPYPYKNNVWVYPIQEFLQIKNLI